MKKIKKKKNEEQPRGLPENVGSVMDSNKNYIMFTTFPGEGEKANDLLSSDYYREALQKIITRMDYNYFSALKESSNLKDKKMPFYIPQTMVYFKELPVELGKAVEHMCETYKRNDEDDTMVLLRFFEYQAEDDAYYPVHVGIEDGSFVQAGPVVADEEDAEENTEEE